MRFEERKNISGGRIKIREAPIKTQSRWPGMSETFHREPAHDGIVVRSRTDGLFERRVIVEEMRALIPSRGLAEQLSDDLQPLRIAPASRYCVMLGVAYAVRLCLSALCP